MNVFSMKDIEDIQFEYGVTPEKVSEEVHSIASTSGSYFDALMKVLDDYGIDYEQAKMYITPSLKRKLTEEAISMNVLKNEYGAHPVKLFGNSI